jgi:molybdopterin-containing oxidoreductase family iron-sulfur binding subunit
VGRADVPVVQKADDSDAPPPNHGEPPRLWPKIQPPGPQWGMAIDLDVCTGCNACAVACQAENNVPVVGPIELAKGRRMHWLRIDRTFDGDAVGFRPMLCQHCEQAPCEYVCPVHASVHSADGLNEQVYNRCVGTRLCSENCPYKVRRFNWYDYAERRDALEVLQLNPDVTVRDRGVMEKCTFCVQRIREGEREARLADRDVEDADVVPACAQACPSRAITFGRIDRPGPVPALHDDPRAYGELDDEMATRPRVRYLARVRRPGETS